MSIDCPLLCNGHFPSNLIFCLTHYLSSTTTTLNRSHYNISRCHSLRYSATHRMHTSAYARRTRGPLNLKFES